MEQVGEATPARCRRRTETQPETDPNLKRRLIIEISILSIPQPLLQRRLQVPRNIVMQRLVGKPTFEPSPQRCERGSRYGRRAVEHTETIPKPLTGELVVPSLTSITPS